MTARLLCTVLLAVSLGCRREPLTPDVQQREVRSQKAASAAAADVASGNRPPATGQLARIRPPPPPCLPVRGAAPAELLRKTAELHEAGEHARVLACADEVLRASPRSVPALRYRAVALAAAGRVVDARAALTRALAVDPDDPETLLAAADLYVSRMTGDREGLLVGLEYALRGARIEAAGRDRDLAARLLVLAAMAENDLGRSRDALAHAEQALRDRPRDASAHYERGVALYELVRFREARASLEKALALSPDDPWTLHYLSLVADHEGDAPRAEELAARARQLAPGEFGRVEIAPEQFEAEVRRAVEALPDHERRALAIAPLELADVPSLDDLTAVDPPLSPAILGLFRGPPETDPCDRASPCRSIVLYRGNLARFARTRAELSEQVRVTLLHELGHLHGETDDELRDRGLE